MPPELRGHGASDGESASEDDLKRLNEMDIDRDFNVWENVRNSAKSSNVTGAGNKFNARGRSRSLAESDVEESEEKHAANKAGLCGLHGIVGGGDCPGLAGGCGLYELFDEQSAWGGDCLGLAAQEVDSVDGEIVSSEELFNNAIEEQNQRNRGKPEWRGKKAMAKAKEAAGAMLDGTSALGERGEKIEGLDDKTSRLRVKASNYAEMARILKEKNKQKAKRFGVL